MRFFQGTETERERFWQAYQQIDRMRVEAGTPVKQAAFLDYAIRCIGRELAAVTSTAQLYGEPVPDISELLIPLICKENRKPQEDALYRALVDYNVICLPWNSSKITSAAFDVFTNGFHPEKGYYNVVLYPELQLAIVINGRHHMAVAASMGQGSAICNTIHLKELFSDLRTDGEYWYRGSDERFPVADFRLALIFCLARDRAALNQSEQIESPSTLLPPVYNTPEEELAQLRWLYRRNYSLEQDNRIMAEKLKKCDT